MLGATEMVPARAGFEVNSRQVFLVRANEKAAGVALWVADLSREPDEPRSIEALYCTPLRCIHCVLTSRPFPGPRLGLSDVTRR